MKQMNLIPNQGVPTLSVPEDVRTEVLFLLGEFLILLCENDGPERNEGEQKHGENYE